MPFLSLATLHWSGPKLMSNTASNENEYFCLISDLSENAFKFPLAVPLPVSILYIVLFKLKYVPYVHNCSVFFYHKGCSIPLNTSSTFVRMILLFPLFPWCGIPSCWFIYLKHLLHPLGELHLIMICNLECIVGFALLVFYWGFIKTLTSYLLMILNYILHFFCCLFISFEGGATGS